MIISCMVPLIVSTTVKIFVILDYLLPSYPPPSNNPGNQNFEKMKNTPTGNIILNMSTVNENYMMYDS